MCGGVTEKSLPERHAAIPDQLANEWGQANLGYCLLFLIRLPPFVCLILTVVIFNCTRIFSQPPHTPLSFPPKRRYLIPVEKKLFLLDGMALVYRAHFALISRPIYTSKGVNTSALYGFTQTLLEILKNQQPTHIAVAFDTDAPTQRHRDFVDYKATRQAMPEDLVQPLPHVRRMLDHFRISMLNVGGYGV